MPRLYATPDDLLDSEAAESLGLAVHPEHLARPPRRLYAALRMASARVDTYARRRFGAPQLTVLASALNAGDTSVSLAGCMGFDASTDTVLQIDPGGATEWLQLQDWTPDPTPAGAPGYTLGDMPPFPGAAQLYPGVIAAQDHAQGTPVQPFFLEYVPLTGGSLELNRGELALTQDGQLAMAHAPYGSGTGTRRGVLSGYPVLEIGRLNLVYAWANVVEVTPVENLFLDFEAGIYRFPLGYFTPDKSTALVTYRGGFTSMRQPVVDAVVSEALAILARRFAPFGATTVSSKGQSYSFANGKSLYSYDAERAIGPMRNLSPY